MLPRSAQGILFRGGKLPRAMPTRYLSQERIGIPSGGLWLARCHVSPARGTSSRMPL